MNSINKDSTETDDQLYPVCCDPHHTGCRIPLGRFDKGGMACILCRHMPPKKAAIDIFNQRWL